MLTFVVCAVVLAACGAEATSGCADVVGVEVFLVGEGLQFDVTVASADTGWEKYADRWEVRDPDGTVLGARELAHPHVDEQPFTRSETVEVPLGTDRVEVFAHDSVEGFCGASMAVALP
ncbi:MAG: hypothetical protein HKN46_08390 [Acidimicrobiia bacterium]|nr:hypothetical protein [Acidimicrobiia bacterium]